MLTMRGGSQVTTSNGVKTAKPPPVPPRPDKSIVADALAKSRKVPAPVLPPGLKKDLIAKSLPDNQSTQNNIKSNLNKPPSPKLNGLSRVKSFIRDVMTDKRHSQEDRKSKEENEKNKTKSQIPVPQIQTLPKHKANDSNEVLPEDAIKSQSVVRSLCGLVNSDKSFNRDSEIKLERVKIVKSNSFVEKAVPVRKAPPPPISPKPSRRQIEDKLARMQNRNEGFSVRKLSVSCEELNNSSRPSNLLSPSCNKIGSPLFVKKNIPPSLPSGKPPLFAKNKSLSSSPTGPGCNGFNFIEKSVSTEDLDASDKKSSSEFGSLSKISDQGDFSEKLISEIISAKNETLLTSFQNERHESLSDSHILNDDNVPSPTIGKIQKLKNTVISCNADRVQCVNVPYEKTDTKGNSDSNSVCSSDSGSSGTGKTILFINSEIGSRVNASGNQEPLNSKDKSDEENRMTKINNLANHELLISELQHMRRDVIDSNKKESSPETPNSNHGATKDKQNIQLAGWEDVDDDGKKIRYSSCQIVIEDQSPVDDSGICLDDNNMSSDESYCLSPTLLSRLKEQYYANLKMSSLQGLPPLPKSLSGFNVSENPSQAPESQPQQNPQPPPVPARSAASFRYGAKAGGTSPTAVNGIADPQRMNRKPTTLDTQLAVLKREMLSLRQLDLSLLSQLWSLNESIHEFRQYMNSGGRSGVGGMGGDGIGGMGGEGDGDMDDDGDDSSSGGEDSRHSPQRL